MSELCSEEGCGKLAVARGLCPMHYQRLRREGTQEFGSVGRPRQYPEVQGKSHRGAPQITVRLEPEAMEWVKANGGAGFLRRIIEKIHQLVPREDFRRAWDQISEE